MGKTKSFFKWTVVKCNDTLHSNCATEAELRQKQREFGGQFSFIVGIVNVVINPSEEQYIVPFVEERNVFSFTLDSGLTTHAYIRQNVVETDESLLPFEDTKTESFYSIPDPFLTHSSSANNDTYLEMNFHLSTETRTY